MIELTQHLTTKRPLRSEAIRERRSSANSRGAATVNGSGSADGLAVRSSPSQNSIASTQSSGSSDDVPPPLPVKQTAYLAMNSDGLPPEKPPHPANFSLAETGRCGATPPPPPPKKPSRPLPPL